MAQRGATGTGADFACGTPAPSYEHVEMSRGLWRAEAANGTLHTRSVSTVVVDTYFHVVASGRSATSGWVDVREDGALRRQLAVLNSDFGPHSIAFRLMGVTRTVNTGWAAGGDELGMKRALRRGGYNSLNVYLLSRISGVLGRCTLPQSAPEGPDVIKDGCTVDSSTVPGGKNRNYNMGKTLTHETGHWFGLYHTFRGGCDGQGDLISDTPAQASATKGCPSFRDSCPSKPGVDPIHNYMDYSTE
ncbi:metalloprotease [Colletotrichum salicis]|uniref:Metalloprotease n=1 Tax=Colletotrichum salicis TaxID=1209931 RepID=A0A135V1E2_9PEZI|nr:metalloprotease [Colletotrichum salicis]